MEDIRQNIQAVGCLNIPIDKLINYINNQLNQGLKMDQVRKNINIGQKRLQKYVKQNNYKYCNKTKNYIYVGAVDPIDPVINSSNTKVLQQPQNSPQGQIFQPQDYNKLLTIITEYEDLKDQLKQVYTWYTKEKDIIDIEIPELKILPNDSKLINKSFKIYEDVLKEFLTFCKDHNNFKMQDLTTQALKEFIEKYR